MAIVEDAVCAGAERRSIVVLPSRTVDRWHEPPAETRAYEERLLCFLFQLRDPRLRMTYVTSLPIAPATVGYYLSMLPARIQRSARARLTLVSLSDAGTRPLSDKLLARTAALERIRRAIPEPDRAYLLAHNSTAAERDLALALDIPIYGPDPAHRALGTKSGSRELFALSGSRFRWAPSTSGRSAMRSRPSAGCGRRRPGWPSW